MSITQADVRRLALALPEVTEADHHGRPSYRLGPKVLATVPDDDGLNVMVDESEARAAAAGSAGCTLLWWGKQLSGLHVRLAVADAVLVAELLDAAWRRRAPARLLREFPDGPSAPR